ncbi:MAG: FKBP-type peptidyl-prolyl cis-trans isomerase [Planctomycetota bacterium]
MNFVTATLRPFCLLGCGLVLVSCSGKSETAAPSTPTTKTETGQPPAPDPGLFVSQPDASNPALALGQPPTPNADDIMKAARESLPKPPVVSEDPNDHPGFKVETLAAGEGAEVVAGKVVKVRYVGTLPNGKEFDSSWTRGVEPAEFPLEGVVPGFRMGLLGMKVGEHRRITIPGELGYGAAGNPRAGIGPNANLYFDVELVEVVDPTVPAKQ